MRRWSLIGIAVTFVGCATGPRTELNTVCVTEHVVLDANFDGGGMRGCRVKSANHIEVWLTPENTPINPSPWYAVRLVPHSRGPVTVTLRYDEHAHRYQPKLRQEGGDWINVADENIQTLNDGQRVEVNVTLATATVFLSGQELVTADTYDAWIDRLADGDGVTLQTIGQSVDQRALRMLSTSSEYHEGTVILVGRQHPPEVTGALAMMSFVDEVLKDSELAKAFRERFGLAIVPLMNPDGVARGHWRHNVGGVDLNRDWGPFSEPETKAVRRVIDALADTPNGHPVLFLDFHSTQRNVFYTQLIGEDGTDYGFTAKWLAQSRARLPDYEFERAERHQSELATSKNYMHGRFAIPAITYEVGDETDRERLSRAGRVFAQEMMRVLLDEHPGS